MTEVRSNQCEYLPWDSEFFGRRIARVLPERLSQDIAEAAEEWCERNSIHCLYLLADATDPQTIRQAEENRFHLVDIRMTLSRKLSEPAPPSERLAAGTVRSATAADVEPLKLIARESHRDSRFYADPHFATEQCDKLYERWIERSCADYADIVFVAEREGRPVGYITCKQNDAKIGQIGLLAVDSRAVGLGLGSALIAAALDWFREHKLESVLVVTQGRNVRAQRCYQRMGFTTDVLQLWYHRWFSDSEGIQP
jgi:dTDP-4-amino-4,6-dideoxy-D-galactose acyltransferase